MCKKVRQWVSYIGDNLRHYLRIGYVLNNCPRLQGGLGIFYDSYRLIGGPFEITLLLVWVTVTIEIGPEFKLGE